MCENTALVHFHLRGFDALATQLQWHDIHITLSYVRRNRNWNCTIVSKKKTPFKYAQITCRINQITDDEKKSKKYRIFLSIEKKMSKKKKNILIDRKVSEKNNLDPNKQILYV